MSECLPERRRDCETIHAELSSDAKESAKKFFVCRMRRVRNGRITKYIAGKCYELRGADLDGVSLKLRLSLSRTRKIMRGSMCPLGKVIF